MFSSVAISKAIPLVANSEVSLATAIHLKDQTSSCRIVQSLHQSFPPVNTINQLVGTTPLVFYTVKTTEPPVEFLVNEPAPFRPDHLELRLPSLNIRVAYPLKKYSRRTSGRNSESRLEIWTASNATGDFRSILTWIPDNRTGGPNLNAARSLPMRRLPSWEIFYQVKASSRILHLGKLKTIWIDSEITFVEVSIPLSHVVYLWRRAMGKVR